MNPLISFIIPVHNGENTLDACVSSITAQSGCDFEIILVENGSADKSAELCSSLHGSDERIKFFQSETGVSNARNMGISQACGKYLCFADDDDELLADAVSFFSEACRKYQGFDIFCATCDRNGDSNADWEIFKDSKITSLLVSFMKKPTKTLAAWGKLFSAEFIRQSGVIFDPMLSHAEDSDFVISAMLAAKSIVVTERAVYKYNITPNSAVRGGKNLLEKYSHAMNTTKGRLPANNAMIMEAFCLYALDNLLIVLVHDICSGSFFSCRRILKSVISDGIFAWSLKNAHLRNMGTLKASMFFFARHGCVFPLWLASRLRNLKK